MTRIANYGASAAPLAVFVLSLLLFSINLDRPPYPDELHHVLAAQHLIETGRPIIAEGEYPRGILYTWLVAASYAVFGDSLSSARIPAVLLVALVAPILFVWVRREAGVLTAWIAATLFLTSPFVVEIAQFARFYCLQMMFFTLGAICTFYGTSAGPHIGRRVILLGLAVVMLALSLWVQETTLIGLVGIGIWVASSSVVWILRDVSKQQFAWRMLALLLVLTGIAALASTMMSDEIAWAWRRYRTASLFAAHGVDEFWYYHLRYVLFYPTLWPMTGLLAVLATTRNSRFTWFAVTVFGISFLMTSLAAQKATRYFSYIQPLIAVIWGIGLGVALPAIWRFTETARSRIAESLAISGRLAEPASRAIVLSAIGILILMNPFWLRTATIIGNIAVPMETPAVDWRAARDALAPWTANADIMVTTEELGAIYFLGRSDVRYSPSKMEELPPGQRIEFGIDPRVGRPVITKPESLERLIECFDSGFIVGPIQHWGSSILISKDVQDVLRRNASPIEVPRNSHLYAWGWKRAPGPVKAPACADLNQFSGVNQ